MQLTHTEVEAIKSEPIELLSSGTFSKGLMGAALSLPLLAGLCNAAKADSAPEKGLVSFKYLDYLDSQPGFDRIKVKAPSILVMKPLSSEWSVSSTATTDTISGASPSYHTQALRSMHDQRHAFDLSFTKFESLGTKTFGGSYSKELDYLSKGLFYSLTSSSEDKNTTWNAGISLSNDQINPTNQIVTNETKQDTDLIAGITKIFSKVDITQYQIGHYSGKGYFSDPYKIFDHRPRERVHNTFLFRWNHYLEESESTMRISYRYYSDDWGIEAHTADIEFVKSLPNGWVLSPSFRLYTQSSAKFFVNADNSGSPFPPSPPAGALNYSEDQRMSAYGAHTLGIKVSKYIDHDTSFDYKVEGYEQRAGWRIMGTGSPGMEPLTARSFQIGFNHYFD
jgi:Protein of unknown function (DUF3570)